MIKKNTTKQKLYKAKEYKDKMKIWILCFCFGVCSIHGLPQFGFPFSKFSDFTLPQMPSFESNDFGLPEADLRMALPSVDGKNINKTTSNKRLKDGTVVKTTNINGPNFMVHEESAFKSSKGGLTSKGKEKGETLPNIGSRLLFGGFPMLGGLKLGKLKLTKKKCNPTCKQIEFCDEDIGKCVPRLDAGYECMVDKNCKEGLKCVWGICNAAKDGEAGTLCKDAKDCGAVMNCINIGNVLTKDKFCTPKLNEGAMCGDIVDALGRDDKINPCARGLKCALVGSSENRLCVRESYREAKSIYEEVKKADKEGSKSGKNKEKNEEENDDNESGDDDNDEDEDRIPVKTKEGQNLPDDQKANAKKNDKSRQTAQNKKKNEKNGKQKDNKLKFIA